ncbi:MULTISPECIES: hypothetical protein [Marinobacter]|uniref:DUF948 domain-containing protein n=1 Tax=Marinobacter alkaliphilus TaxID=254719 RepID=A0ABZ3E9G2_9GAMM|nr:hypothetical protein [Marinobacter sp. LQ44]AMQ87345.1 hypothetical protein ASQ50_00830 [Marinobacter sp. LQ44]
MSVWALMIVQVLLTAGTVAAVLFAFWYLVVRPWLAERMRELVEAADQIEPKVAKGVNKGVADAVRQLPQNAWEGATKESTKQFLKFGSNLFENGLSSFLGSTAEMQKSQSSSGSRPPGQGDR